MDLFLGTLLAVLFILVTTSPLLYEVYKLKDRKLKTSPYGRFSTLKARPKNTFLWRR